MKKSSVIKLVLITGALASCHKPKPEASWDSNEVYMRSDSTANYTRTQGHHLSPILWYYAFRPYGMYYGGRYHHSGYYSSSISESSNIGRSVAKGAAIRGGFGGSH
eukprot:gene19347-23011_t